MSDQHLSVQTWLVLAIVRKKPECTTRQIQDALSDAGLNTKQAVGQGGSFHQRANTLVKAGYLKSKLVLNPEPGPPRIRTWRLTHRGERALQRFQSWLRATGVVR